MSIFGVTRADHNDQFPKGYNQFVVTVILDFFKMADTEIECSYFVSYLQLCLKYLNDLDVNMMFMGSKYTAHKNLWTFRW